METPESPTFSELLHSNIEFLDANMPDILNISNEFSLSQMENILDNLPSSPVDSSFSQTILSPPSPFKDPAPITNHDPRKRHLLSLQNLIHPAKKSKTTFSASPAPGPSSVTDPHPQHQMSGSGTKSFQIMSDIKSRNKKFKTDTRLITFTFRDLEDEENLMEYLARVFSDLLDFLPQEGVHPHDRVGLSISNSDRPQQPSIGISLRRADQLTTEVIMQTVEKILQSNEGFFLRGVMQVN